jgi:hypothetical protein
MMEKLYYAYIEQRKLKREADLLEASIRADERARIIALIESKDEWHYAFSDVSDVIALIKGESK